VLARLARIVLAMAALSLLSAPSAAAKLHVSGNHLVDRGQVVRLLGVNRSGTEYQCTKRGRAIFDGPNDQRSIDAMKTWRINTVRVPLNESCWLGVGRLRKRKVRYRRAIARYVRLLRRNGLYVILEYHFAAPGRRIARDHLALPPASHAPAFWRSVGRRFRRTSGVAFDLFNEPHDVSWRCWLRGCRVSRRRVPPSGKTYPAYRAAGMARLLRVLRKTGAKQPVLLGGLAYARDLSQWLSHKPRGRQLVASLHTYGPVGDRRAAPCVGVCRDEVAEIARRYPVVAGEIGEYDCLHGYIDDFMAFADANGISYLGWAWDAVAPGSWQCGSGPALIENYNGTPTAFGIGLRDHLLAR
jgi:Cellulase (glycosyl hydrolase family 5)